MKSIIEESSSIAKAIEAAWIRAEKPHEFSIKIFEEPEKNFFGMVTKSAKIALIFKHVEKKSAKEYGAKQKTAPESTSSSHTKEYARKEHPRRERESSQREIREPRESREPRQERREQREPMVRELTRKEFAQKSAREQEQLSIVPQEQAAPHEQEGKERVFWTEEMIEVTHAWIDTLLKNMQCGDITFKLEPKRYYLTIAFDKPVRETKALEQQLFRSCAYLIMQMLRTKLKKQFRGLKVVLSSPA